MRTFRISLIAAAFLVSSLAAQEPYGDLGDFKLAKPEDKEDVKSVPAPSGAIQLFDGKNLDNWVKTDGKMPAAWKLVPSDAMQVEKGGNILTKQKFGGSFKLHVEFRVPYMPRDRPGPRQQRCLPSGPLRSPGSRQLWAAAEEQRVRRHL